MDVKRIKNDLYDLIDIDDIDYIYKISDIIKELDEKVLEVYKTQPSLSTLEEIKTILSANLIYMSTLFGKIRKYKGSNHTYLEDARKQLKSNCILKMEGSTSKRKEEVYSNEDYVRVNKSLLKLKEQFITIEELYESFQRLFQSIQQTISTEAKSFQGAHSI